MFSFTSQEDERYSYCGERRKIFPIVEKNGVLSMNQNHNYFYQINKKLVFNNYVIHCLYFLQDTNNCSLKKQGARATQDNTNGEV